MIIVKRARNLMIGGRTVTFKGPTRAWGFVKELDESRDLYILKPFHLLVRLWNWMRYGKTNI